jgi:hypothetical protein
MKGIRVLSFATIFTASLIAIVWPSGGGATGAPVPTIGGVSGSVWSFSCPSSFNGYLEVPYAGRYDSGARQLTITGKNLQAVTSCAISAPGYSVTIAGRSATSLVLDVRAGSPGENPRPVANPTLTLVSAAGPLRTQVRGLIPTLYTENLDWGQCTWYAGGIARIQSGRPVVRSYAQGVAINPNPSSAGFPRNGSVLMKYEKHMAFLESIRQTSRVQNRNGTVITYQLAGSQYNARCDAQRSPFTATMVISQSPSGQYSFVQRPVVVYEIDRVAQ